MTDPKDHLIAWLRDAHAAEEQSATMLSNLSKRLENYPELKARIDEHVVETRRQAERVQQCLKSYDTSTSTLKEAGTRIMGFGQALSGMFTDDEVIKAVLACYTFEHMEIASYKILVAAARRVGDSETERVCAEILQEELAMAKWLEERLDDHTDKFFDLEVKESVTAKH